MTANDARGPVLAQRNEGDRCRSMPGVEKRGRVARFEEVASGTKIRAAQVRQSAETGTRRGSQV